MRQFTLIVCGLTCGLAVSTASAATLVAHYTFDQSSGSTATDSVGGINGTLTNGASFVSGGIAGNALSLSGASNQYVTMGNNFGSLPTSSFSSVVWIKTTQTGPGFVISKHNGGTLNGFITGVNDLNAGGGGLGATSKATTYVSTSNNPAAPISTTTVNDGAWHQIVSTYVPGGALSLYVDGVFQDSKASQTYVTNTSAFLVGGIGQNNSDNTPVGDVTGLIDDVQLYSGALTAAEITSLFNAPQSTVPEPASLALLAVGIGGLLMRRGH